MVIIIEDELCHGKTELFNDWGGRGYDESVPGEIIKTAPSGDRTT